MHGELRRTQISLTGRSIPLHFVVRQSEWSDTLSGDRVDDEPHPANREHRLGLLGHYDERAEAAWPIAFAAIQQATGAEADAVRAFLDSRHGRHFADEVSNRVHAGASLANAIARATETWMAWRIGRRTSRDTGIPAGLPYLTGFVLDAGIAAEVAAA